MQEFKFNVTGTERKKLVGAISEILNMPMNYLGAPTFSYEVGDYTINKNGTVSGEFNLGLFATLEQKGFTYKNPKTYHLITPRGTFLIRDHFATAEEAEASGYGVYFHHEGRDVYIKPNGKSEHGKHFAVVGAPFEPDTVEPQSDRLVIEIPLDGFTPESIENLCKMVKAKENLMMTALGADNLPILILEDRIRFPWFSITENSERANAYAQLITALCNTAKEKKRITTKAQDGFENEKFAMRVWLIGLGCVGSEYKYLRKIMGEFLSGNSAFRCGKPEKGASAENTPIPAENEVACDE